MSIDRALLPGFMALYFFIAMALPSFRVWRMTGKTPVTFRRSTAPLQRAVGIAFLALAVLMVVWTLVYAAAGPEAVGIWRAPRWVALTGWAAMTAGLIVTIIAQAQMGASWRIGIDSEPTLFVSKGLFRWVRNPIFSSMLLTFLGLAVITPAPLSILGWIATAVVISFQTRLEEQHLSALHGNAYRQYAARVGRFIPGIGLLRELEKAS